MVEQILSREEKINHREKQLLKLIEASNKFIDHSEREINYQDITDDMLEISGGKYVGFNLFKDNGKEFTTIAFAGVREHLKKGIDILGFNPINKNWKDDPIKAAKIKNKNIIILNSLSELTGEVISKRTVQLIERVFNLGQVIVVKIMKGEKSLGDFTIFLEKGEMFHNKEIVELYASQVGLFIEKFTAEQKLLESKKKFELAIDVTEAGIWDWDLETNRVEYSGKWKSMLGYDEDEIENTFLGWKKLWHPEEITMIEETINDYQSGRTTTYEVVHRLRHKNGDWKWILTRGDLLKNSEGHPYRWVGTNVDLTEIKKKEEQIILEKQRLGNILEGTNAGTWEWNIQTGETVFNERWAEIIGYNLAEISPTNIETWQTFLHPDDSKESEEKLKLVFEKKEEYYSIKCRMKHKKGHWVWILDKGKVISWAKDGKPLVMLGTHIDITDTEKLEQAIKEKDKKYRVIVENSYDIIYRLSTEGLFTYVSKSFNLLLGYSTDEVLGKSFQQYLHPEDIQLVNDFFNLIKTANNRQESAEYRFRHKDGSWRWYTSNAIPIWDETGNIIEIAGTSQDITELKKANQDLMNTKDELEQFFSVNLDLLCITDMEGNFKRINKSWERILGYSTEYLETRNIMEFIHPDDINKTIEAISRLENQEQVTNFVNRYRTQEGCYRYIEWRSQPHGNLIYGAARDVTDNKKIAEALHLEKELFRTTLLSVGDGVISTDNKGQITVMNQVAEGLTGWSQEEAQGKQLKEIYNIIEESSREPIKNLVSGVIKKSEISEASNILLISKSGQEIYIEDSVAPIKDSYGENIGVVIVFRDCTEKKEKQKQVEYLSFHDHLTGLYNRRYMEDALKRLDTPRNLPFSIMVLDVNGLKLTNDTFGHEMGDILLKKVAEIITKTCRADDIICRVGGDEFVILLPKTDLAQAKNIKQRISSAALETKLDSVIVSLAIGYAVKNHTEQSTAELQKEADNNMYKNKNYSRAARICRNPT